MRFGMLFLAVLGAIAQSLGAGQAPGDRPPDFGEIGGLIRSNLAGVTPSELDEAALEGVLHRFRGRVSLVGGSSAAGAAPQDEPPSLSRTNVFDGRFGYVRLASVGPHTARELAGALDAFKASSRLEGLILDLRSASGTHYAAAAQTADPFLSDERVLLRWAGQTASSTAKSNALTAPVAVLINSNTAGAAEALAGILRENGVGLLIGSVTAGMASVFREFPLSNGQKLLVATSAVELGSGETVLTEGLTPDIAVAVVPQEEALFLADPYRRVTPPDVALAKPTGPGTAPTNRPARVTEADLVKARREGVSLGGDDGPLRSQTPAEPVVTDPALARALDLLKGLAAVRPDRSGGRRGSR